MIMAVTYVRATLRCDRCNDGFDFITNGLTMVRKRARAAGWTVAGRRDLCPNCRARQALNAKHGKGAG
jgi:hypothetical protein